MFSRFRFNTPYRRFHFNGQKQLETALVGLNSIAGIAEDTSVHGSSEEEHDKNLINLMERAQTWNHQRMLRISGVSVA